MIKFIEAAKPFEYPVLMQSRHNPGLVVLFFNESTAVTIKNEDYLNDIGKAITFSNNLLATNIDMWHKLPKGTQVTFIQE